MRYISMLFGLIRLTLLSLLSGKRISYVFPARMGRNVIISARPGGAIRLKKRVSLNANSHIAVTQDAQLQIGEYTGIGDNDVIVARERIVIGSNVMIGPNVCIYDHDHVFREPGIMRDLGFKTAPVTIEDNVWIGAGCIILKGVTIGEGSVVAAGTVVNKSVPANSIVYKKSELVICNKFE